MCPAPVLTASNAKRRGPMDEMRQLQRILTKLLPGSIIYMPNQDGGGNKVGSALSNGGGAWANPSRCLLCACMCWPQNMLQRRAALSTGYLLA